MAFTIQLEGDGLKVALSGWDRAFNLRHHVEFDSAEIGGASVVERSSLEALVDHRVLGWGTHVGSRRPNRRRVGTMLGRGVAGKQFWAVASGEGSRSLLVLDLHDHEFSRAVLEVSDPEATASLLAHTPRTG